MATTALEELLAKLNPKTRKLVLSASEVEYEKIPTPSLSLNYHLKGGLPAGRQVLFYGSKSSGKSSFMLQMIGMAQKEGKICAFLDAEGTFDKAWAEKLGVDTEQLIYSPVKSINHFTDLTVELCNAGIDIVVVDSITALLPGIFFEKDSSDLKPMDQTGQIGSISRDLGNAVKMINYVNEKTLLVLISQVRFNIGGLYASHTFTGGNAVKFYSSTVVKLFSSESSNNAIEGDTVVGDKIIKSKVGREVAYNIEFSKTSPAFVTGKYDFYFTGDDIGVDQVADVVDTAEMLGLIEKGGAWYTVLDQRIQGRAKVIEYLRENKEAFETLKAKVMEAC